MAAAMLNGSPWGLKKRRALFSGKIRTLYVPVLTPLENTNNNNLYCSKCRIYSAWSGSRFPLGFMVKIHASALVYPLIEFCLLTKTEIMYCANILLISTFWIHFWRCLVACLWAMAVFFYSQCSLWCASWKKCCNQEAQPTVSKSNTC